MLSKISPSLLLFTGLVAVSLSGCPSSQGGAGEGEGEGEAEEDLLLTCGNNSMDVGEECDGTDFADVSCESLGYSSGALGCSFSCSLDRQGCSPQASCGDGTLNTTERCEGLELRGETCTSQGRGAGTLSCRDDCTYDFSGCQSCGNGFIEGAEVCDGPRVGSRTCASEFGETAFGTLSCNSECSGTTSSGCELPYGGSCNSGASCTEHRFSEPGVPQSACALAEGSFSAEAACNSDTVGSCTTTFSMGDTPDEIVIYYYEDTGDAEETCTSAGGRWSPL